MYGLVALIGLITIGYLSIKAVGELHNIHDSSDLISDVPGLELFLYLNVGANIIYLLTFVLFSDNLYFPIVILFPLLFSLVRFKKVLNTIEENPMGDSFKYLTNIESGFNVVLSNILFIFFTYIFYVGLRFGIT